MKYEYIRGRFTATAENLADVKTLMSLSGGFAEYEETNGTHGYKRKKACDICGRRVASYGSGRASHMRKHQRNGEGK